MDLAVVKRYLWRSEEGANRFVCGRSGHLRRRICEEEEGMYDGLREITEGRTSEAREGAEERSE